MTQLVGGRYSVIAHIGGGLVSDVSLAKRDAEIAVIKRLKLGADAESNVLAVFAAEAKQALRLDHPNIVHAIESGEDADGPFLAMEYLDGVTLARIRGRAKKKEGGFPRAIALHIIKEAAAGLAYAHELREESNPNRPILHRDVAPENIIVTYEGTTKLIDFSVMLGATPTTAARAGTAKVNLAYVAPEQARAGVNLDARADVFSLGIVLWELLAGKRLWEGMSEVDVLAKLDDLTPLPTLKSVVPDIPDELDALCTQALAKVRDDRFDSAVELRAAIEKAAKATNLEATKEQVGALVTSLFEDDHQKMKTLIAEALERPADAAAGSVPRMAPVRNNSFADVESDPSLSLRGVPPAATSQPIIEVVRVEADPAPDRRFAWAMVAVVVVAFAAVAVVAMTRDPKLDEKKPDEGVARRRGPDPAMVRPSATAPIESAYVEPEQVTVDINVSPGTAQLTIDGVKTNNPHRAKVVPGKFPHEIRAELEGFEPFSTTIPFDRTRTVDIVLQAVKKPSAPTHRPAPPKPEKNE